MITNKNRLKTDIETLAGFNATPENGITRFSYTEEYRLASDYIIKQMEEAGLSVYTDPVGTIVGRLEGRNPELPSIMLGSHLDSIRNGGMFDGTAGIAAAIEICRVMREEGFQPETSIEIAAFPEIEGSQFGASLLGSRCLSGQLDPQELLHHINSSGITLYDALTAYGCHPQSLLDGTWKAPRIGQFLELHIEQGPILSSGNYDLGIVDAIAGVQVFQITIHGRADHAATTPMTHRADSFLTAARAAIAVNDAALSLADGSVATVASVKVKPDEYNIVPSETSFTVDIRSRSDKSRIKIYKVLRKFLESTCQQGRDLTFESKDLILHPSVQMDTDLKRLLLTTSRELHFSAVTLTSGTYHDAEIMAQKYPTAMLFIPCRSGKTHCAEERTDYSDLQNGTETLYYTVKKLSMKKTEQPE